MKSFTVILALAASAAIVHAQDDVAGPVFNASTNSYLCPGYKPNGNFCADGSLKGSIIIRCTNGIGHAGNCNDNLDGEPPQGVSFSPCWQTTQVSGDAACSKNCIVYPDTGPQFSLPGCVPTSISSTSTPSSTPPPSSASDSTVIPITTTITSNTTVPVTTTTPSSNSTIVTFTTTYALNSTTAVVTSTPGSNSTIPVSSQNATSTLFQNGTVTTSGTTPSQTGGSGGSGGNGGESGATGTPIAPPSSTVSTIPQFTGAANALRAGSTLAAFGIFAAYFL